MKLSEFVEQEFQRRKKELLANTSLGSLAAVYGMPEQHVELSLKFEILLTALDESGFRVIDE